MPHGRRGASRSTTRVTPNVEPERRPGAPARAGAPGTTRLSLGVRAFALAARATAAAAATAAAVAVAARTLLARLARRRVLRPLDELLGRHRLAVLVLLDELQPDPAARLVDLLDEHVEHVAARDHVLDVVDPPRPDVRHVEEAVGPLLELHERAEVGRLDDLPRVLVADLGLLREGGDRGDRGVGLRARRGVDEDRAVLFDVDLHLVLGLERPDRLAALADDHPDVLGVDLDRGDPWRGLRELGPRLRNRVQHPLEDGVPRPLRLRERVLHDLAA